MVLAPSDVEDHWAPAGPEEDGHHRPTRALRVCVVGSNRINVFPQALLEFLMEALPNPTQILLRRANKAPVGHFERLVRELASQSHHLTVRWMLPDPGGGAGAAFNRDNEMVALSDLVLAFFDPEHVMEGGTGHVVETAVDRNVPVYSYALDAHTLIRVGDHDPDAIWQQTVMDYLP